MAEAPPGQKRKRAGHSRTRTRDSASWPLRSPALHADVTMGLPAVLVMGLPAVLAVLLLMDLAVALPVDLTAAAMATGTPDPSERQAEPGVLGVLSRRGGGACVGAIVV
ncbi:hypothetical protein PF005_g25770 [Phytophthora fragariae]|uniref:Uncharacterized protein n=1 Tax=Phytophthora fragariae TaxID=53985 RepID=A0A6A3Q1J8_9STRA|nr:hypothetical protein PF003_g29302 [Phytophthora fragariae]KAE8928366.1 hypothetical protein PF009_g21490 [Phytophthora fragariae]KAE8975716.1 hypothetical protein PF011_g24354 [Phytophthora fragariae]KAE9066783.1 hypothetical protein PF007_g28311 [Phytophthora fragariae]KAE9174643.1 hypothetical protein PF005_g25770 [Phytophthora fragariae]